jgi:hypothetical protein
MQLYHYHKKYLLFFFAILLAQCRQAYEPAAITNNNLNSLVVDGTIISGPDSTIIKLSRTRILTNGSGKSPELNANVEVEGKNGDTYTLTNLGNGSYAASGLSLNMLEDYRININTSDGKNYVSDYTPVKQSPPIDSLSWKKDSSGNVNIYANTHDLQKNTRYYRWEFMETWEYHSFFETFYHYNPKDTSVYTDTTAEPHICWDNHNSTDILIASSIKLSDDIIYQAPITSIEANSDRISVKYSILVKQYPLTLDGFNYWQALKQSSEQSGTLYDQEPSQITGNVHCITKPDEIVLGYVGASSVSSYRIFIDNSQVAPWSPTAPCGTIALHSRDSLAYDINTGGWLVVKTEPAYAYMPNAYIMSSDFCIDCTSRRGTTTKPLFWP